MFRPRLPNRLKVLLTNEALRQLETKKTSIRCAMRMGMYDDAVVNPYNYAPQLPKCLR